MEPVGKKDLDWAARKRSLDNDSAKYATDSDGMSEGFSDAADPSKYAKKTPGAEDVPMYGRAAPEPEDDLSLGDSPLPGDVPPNGSEAGDEDAVNAKEEEDISLAGDSRDENLAEDDDVPPSSPPAATAGDKVDWPEVTPSLVKEKGGEAEEEGGTFLTQSPEVEAPIKAETATEEVGAGALIENEDENLD